MAPRIKVTVTIFFSFHWVSKNTWIKLGQFERKKNNPKTIENQMQEIQTNLASGNKRNTWQVQILTIIALFVQQNMPSNIQSNPNQLL